MQASTSSIGELQATYDTIKHAVLDQEDYSRVNELQRVHAELDIRTRMVTRSEEKARLKSEFQELTMKLKEKQRVNTEYDKVRSLISADDVSRAAELPAFSLFSLPFSSPSWLVSFLSFSSSYRVSFSVFHRLRKVQDLRSVFEEVPIDDGMTIQREWRGTG